MEVTKDKIKASIVALVDDTTSYNCLVYSSLDAAIEQLINDKYSTINEFDVLTQQMIDEQAENYDGYLEGAEVGQLVWGDDEMWVSQLTVDGWQFHSEDRLGKSHNDIVHIADYVESSLIVEVLSDYNDKGDKR